MIDEPKTTDELGRFTPGNGGRPKGVPNKATRRSREVIAAILENNVDKVQGWLEAIETKDGPRAAFDCVMSLMEFGVPKLARTELTGEDGGPIQYGKVVRAIVRPDTAHTDS